MALSTIPAELISTKHAAECCGISTTHFERLAAQQPAVKPQRVKGSVVKVWTLEQVAEIKGRKKRTS